MVNTNKSSVSVMPSSKQYQNPLIILLYFSKLIDIIKVTKFTTKYTKYLTHFKTFWATIYKHTLYKNIFVFKLRFYFLKTFLPAGYLSPNWLINITNFCLNRHMILLMYDTRFTIMTTILLIFFKQLYDMFLMAIKFCQLSIWFAGNCFPQSPYSL